MPIALLDDSVVNQIAAGEVVERPASVVKELVENALDAGARSVSVRIVDGGIARIEVRDDGHGIPRAELRLALLRHATSKLRGIDDLERLSTLGFRGEALPSIASVSRLRLQSRAAGSDIGYRISVPGGEPGPEEPCAMAQGTIVLVEDLFGSVPARRKFLGSPESEARRVAGVLERLALAAPAVAFSLEANGREVLRTAGSGNLVEVFADLFGRDLALGLLPVERTAAGFTVRGLCGRPGADRGNRQLQFLIVGGRPVIPGSLRFAIEAGYQGRLQKSRFPVFCLTIRAPEGEVDANVHPAKLEVRFRRERELSGVLHAAVREALAPLPGVWSDAAPGPAAEITFTPGAGEDGMAPVPALLFAQRNAPLPYAAFDEAAASIPAEQPLPGMAPVPVAQTHRLFILAQDAEALYIFDQHAAHERISYERLEDAASRSAQMLLAPAVVRLSAAQAAQLPGCLEELDACGFRVEPFGQRDALVRSVPRILGEATSAQLLPELIDSLGQTEDAVQRRERLRREIAACRASIKANEALSPPEQAALVQELWRCREPRFCPHGRPTFLRLAVSDLRARFGRR